MRRAFLLLLAVGVIYAGLLAGVAHVIGPSEWLNGFGFVSGVLVGLVTMGWGLDRWWT